MKQIHNFYFCTLSIISALYLSSCFIWLLIETDILSYKSVEIVVDLISGFGLLSFAGLTYYHTVYKPQAKVAKLDKHIKNLSSLLKKATDQVLECDFYQIELKYQPNYDSDDAEYARYEAVVKWTTEVNNYFDKNGLVMYGVFFGYLHEVNPNTAQNILNDKRKELKEIIRDLNNIKNKI